MKKKKFGVGKWLIKNVEEKKKYMEQGSNA